MGSPRSDHQVSQKVAQTEPNSPPQLFFFFFFFKIRKHWHINKTRNKLLRNLKKNCTICREIRSASQRFLSKSEAVTRARAICCSVTCGRRLARSVHKSSNLFKTLPMRSSTHCLLNVPFQNPRHWHSDTACNKLPGDWWNWDSHDLFTDPFRNLHTTTVSFKLSGTDTATKTHDKLLCSLWVVPRRKPS